MSAPNGRSHSKESVAGCHPIFWLDDGSLVLQVEAVKFKVHRTLLTRQSPFLSSENAKFRDDSLEMASTGDRHECAYIRVDSARNVSAADCEVLLQHLYHDMPLCADSPFPRLASIVRASSPEQLHFPRIHEGALRYFEDQFPSGPAPFIHPQHLEEALALATSFNVTSIQKGLLYSLVTSTNFDTEGTSPENSETDTRSLDVREIPGETGPETAPPLLELPSNAHKFSSLDSQRCMRLMTHFIEHFSPILFTPPATPHMACTDVFAETWMALVIQPALDDDGVYKPLETLQRIKNIDWANAGLCATCVSDKNAEWTEEQETIWRLMDQWLDL
ncbi:hypothetical protein C8R45DRAFT_812194 [Mycena sanguinolenta]|nr:hypothetical protein C8R45DRAFT_812194 [Mycena sanguinolenta]